MKIEKIKQEYPNNLMARYFDTHYFYSLAEKKQQRLEKIIQSGVNNPDSLMGIYARDASDYNDFSEYLDRVICDYHHVDKIQETTPHWLIPQSLDLEKISPELSHSSMRVRVGRNVKGYPLPAAMDKLDRVKFENSMICIFEKLMLESGFGGKYVSLTPNSPYEIDQTQYQTLVDEHKMFKDMSHDKYLNIAGISSDWPYGRGMYISSDEQFIIWVGEEDHLRIMVMKHGNMLNDIFDRLHTALRFLGSDELTFSHVSPYGFITSCPTNLGTAMRASLHIALPKLTNNGQDLAALKAVAKKLKLSVRGAGGEHSDAGAGGVVDISPSVRLMVSESEIAQQLYTAVKTLWAMEKTSETSACSTEK